MNTCKPEPMGSRQKNRWLIHETLLFLRHVALALSGLLVAIDAALADNPKPGVHESISVTQRLPASGLEANVSLFSHESHISDALLLQDRMNRATLKYEGINLTLSYDVLDRLFLYGGGGFLVEQQPSEIAPGMARFGIDFDSPWLFDNDTIHSVISSEVKMHEEYKWSSDFSVRAGFRFKPSRTRNTNWSVMAEYFSGHHAQGQFYRHQVDYTGIALHCRF